MVQNRRGFWKSRIAVKSHPTPIYKDATEWSHRQSKFENRGAPGDRHDPGRSQYSRLLGENDYRRRRTTSWSAKSRPEVLNKEELEIMRAMRAEGFRGYQDLKLVDTPKPQVSDARVL